MRDEMKAAQTPHEAFLFVINGEAPAETTRPSGQRGKKRAHYKSRRGCLSCKRRRVKCDERSPCSNCLKRKEICSHSSADTNTSNDLNPSAPQPSSPFAGDDVGVNLLHLELFYHFQKEIMDTITFPEIWQQVLPWAFQEPFIMCPVLCLAATHLSTLHPQVTRYSRVALRLLGKSAALFNEKLSSPVTIEHSEALIATSILMHYISWGHVEFLKGLESGQLVAQDDYASLATYLAHDPLFQLSSGVRGIYFEVFPLLGDRGNMFVSAILYSARPVIEEAILQRGHDPGGFIDYFMGIWDDPACQPPQESTEKEMLSHSSSPIYHPVSSRHGCVYAGPKKPTPTVYSRPTSTEKILSSRPQAEKVDTAVQPPPQSISNPQRMAFRRIAERLSLLLCLVSIATYSEDPLSTGLLQLQPDIERCFWSFPVLCGAAFRDLALHGDARALIVLYHFYHAARILLTSPSSWWARQRSNIIETLILRELRSRGLESCIVWPILDMDIN